MKNAASFSRRSCRGASSTSDRIGNVLTVAFLSGVYWWTQVAARFYPGSTWTDPEFLKPGQAMSDLGVQAYLDTGATVLVLLASWLMWPRRTEPGPA